MSGRTRYTKIYEVPVITGQQRYNLDPKWRAKDITFRDLDYPGLSLHGGLAGEIRKDEEGWFFWLASVPKAHGTLKLTVKEKEKI